MKKILALSFALVMLFSLAACGKDSTTAGQDEAPAAQENISAELTPAERLLHDVKGSYEELFTVICGEEYDSLWLADCAQAVGEDMAQTCADMLKSACCGELYGEAAAKAYADAPETAQFDCYFINGVRRFVFDGDKISGADADGNTVFEHSYSFAGEASLGGLMDGYLYETQEAGAGEFRYFFLMPDTPASTYHIEFRYGSDKDALMQYAEGPYAYWLAAGIPVERDETLVENVIKLFCEENLAEAQGEGGEETSAESLEIGSAAELAEFAAKVRDGSMSGYAGVNVMLTADIDCSGMDWQPIGTMNLENPEDVSCMFQGVFDGQGHTISNVSFSAENTVCGAGVFGVNLGEVKNLKVKNVQVHCSDYSIAIGAVVGYNMGSVHDITLSGENEIEGVNCVGGVVGGSKGAVYNCTAEGTTVRVLGDNDFSDGRIIQCDIAECGGLVIGGSYGGTIENCSAKGKVIAEGSEPIGLGGVAGCLEMMDSIKNCSAEAEIVTTQGGHAIGGLCGYSGTHPVGDIVADTAGMVTHNYPAEIENCSVNVKMTVPGATHVGGLVGTGLFYYGEETAFKVMNCSVKADISGAITPGAVAGRAVNSVIESCETDVTLDGAPLTDKVGQTDRPYESADQGEEE